MFALWTEPAEPRRSASPGSTPSGSPAKAGRLQTGDELLSATGTSVWVANVESTGDRETVYNLEVAEAHTYFVGETQTWVHNQCTTNVGSQSDRLFPNFGDDELEQAFSRAQSRNMFELPGQNPANGQGLRKLRIVEDETKNLAYQQNMTFKQIDGAPSPKVEVRYHSANANAPAGTYSQTNPTTQINSVDPQLYMLPDGTWKPFNILTEEERALVHFP
jgi:hypothetical protein